MAMWDKQQGETATAFSWFARYRDLGPERSLKKVREMAGKGPGYVRRLERWSVQHNWVARAAEWDMHLDRLVQQQQIDAVLAMRERQLRLAAALQAKVIERLQKMSPDELTPATLIRWFEVSVKIERLNRLELAQTGVPCLDKHPRDMTDEELEAAMVQYGIL